MYSPSVGYQQQQQSVVQCTMRAERLLATLVYLMLIVAGDIELNPGPTLSESNINSHVVEAHNLRLNTVYMLILVSTRKYTPKK